MLYSKESEEKNGTGLLKARNRQITTDWYWTFREIGMQLLDFPRKPADFANPRTLEAARRWCFTFYFVRY
jgi:hypothetical protein